MHSHEAYLFLAAMALSLSPLRAQGQSSDVNAIHWAYSTYFGTGWYQVSDSRDAFAVRYAPRKLIREQSLVEGTRVYGIELRVPITVGLEHFPLDDIRGSVDPENLANISVTPSVNLQIPVTERWTLRPYVALGWGTVLNGSESAWTYWGGIRSRYRFASGKLNASWLQSIGFVGYSPNNGPSSDFWPVMTGVEFGYPLGDVELQGEQLLLNWHGSYTYFADEMELLRLDRSTEKIRDQWQVGIGISKKETPVAFWRLRFDRIGVAYRFSSDGELKGIGFVFRSLFDQ